MTTPVPTNITLCATLVVSSTAKPIVVLCLSSRCLSLMTAKSSLVDLKMYAVRSAKAQLPVISNKLSVTTICRVARYQVVLARFFS